MAKDTEARIAELLSADDPELQVAAALVLGALKSKSKAARAALVELLDKSSALQVAGADALAKVGVPKDAHGALIGMLKSAAPSVRQAAQSALISAGDVVVKTVQARYVDAGAEEKRGLDAILAALGGKDATGTLLDGLLAKEPDAARQAALRIRQTIKDASGNERRSYRAQLEKFIKRDDVQKTPHSLAAGLKIMAYLEDEKTLPVLLAYATDNKYGVLVRSEATIGLRFALKSAEDQIVKALLEVAHDDERVLAQTALDTLALVEIPDKHLAAFAKVATHRDLARASFVIRGLGLMPSKKSAQSLVKLLPDVNLRRTELIKDALEPRVSEVASELVKAALSLEDSEKTLVVAKLLARAAKDDAKLIKPAQKKQLVDETIKRLKDGSAGWEALIQVAREVDAAGLVDGLRALAQKLKKAKKVDQAISVLTLLKKTEGSTTDDGYKLASLLLSQSRQDTSATARSRDPALAELESLAKDGHDVLSALKKDKSLDNKALFYVGFHFAEKAHILGEELLEEVIKKGGRTKIAKMAKNKLKLVQDE